MKDHGVGVKDKLGARLSTHIIICNVGQDSIFKVNLNLVIFKFIFIYMCVCVRMCEQVSPDARRGCQGLLKLVLEVTVDFQMCWKLKSSERTASTLNH